MPQIYRFPFSIQQGSFDTPIVPGLSIIDGLSFAPQLVLFFGSGRKSSEESTILNDCGSFMGAASVRNGVVNQWVTNHYQKDNVNPTQTVGKNSQSLCISLPESTTTFYFQAQFITGFGSGFVLDFTDVDSFPRTINYYAVGGLNGTSDVVCGTMTNTAGTGLQSVTGLGFRPDVILWKHDFVSGTVHDDLGAAVNTTPLQDWCVSMFSQSAVSPSNAKEIFDMDRRCIMNYGSGATQCEIEMSSYDTDGFTVNKITQDAVTRPYNFIAIKGVQAKAGTFLSGSGTVHQRTVTGLGFSPFLLLVAGSGQSSVASSMTQISNAIRSYGVAREVDNQITYCYSDGDGVATTQCASFFSQDYIISFLDNNPVNSLVQRGYLSAISGDGFTIDFDISDGFARRCFYLALGGNANAGREGRGSIDGMDIAPGAMHYMTIPHFTASVAYASWSVYIFKNGQRLTDIPYDIMENPLGSYTFSFQNDGEDQAQWTMIAYQTSSPNDRYVEAWRVRSLAAEAAVFDIQSRQGQGGNGGSGVGGSPGPSIGRG